MKANSDFVSEHETASFTVFSSTPVDSPLPVNMILSQTGDFTNNFIENHTVTFDVGEDTKLFEIELVDDEIRETSGQLTVTISEGADYTIANEPSNVATIELHDDDTPELSITGTSPIKEGETAEFCHKF